MTTPAETTLRKHIEQRFPDATETQIDQYLEEYRVVANLIYRFVIEDLGEGK